MHLASVMVSGCRFGCRSR